jgi:hypothetical protein
VIKNCKNEEIMNFENGDSEEKKILSTKYYFAKIKDFQLRKQTRAKKKLWKQW